MSTSKTLPALIADSQAISCMLLESDGEITPAVEVALSVHEVELPKKIEGYVFTLEELEMREAYFKEKAEYFNQIAKSFSLAQEIMKDRLIFYANELKVDEFTGTDHKISFIPSKPSVVIEDVAKIDQLYMTEKIVKSPDKVKIAEDLKLGIPVPGAALREGKHIKISANRKALK